MRVALHPDCMYPEGHAAHLLQDNFICVAEGSEPKTLERAKAIAMHWITGFENYRRSGAFYNGPQRVNVIEVPRTS